MLAWLGEAEAALTLGQDTVERTRGRFGSENPVTLASEAKLALAEATLILAPILRGDAGALAGLAGRAERARSRAQETLRLRRLLGGDSVTTVIAEATLFAVDAMLVRVPQDEGTVIRFAELLGAGTQPPDLHAHPLDQKSRESVGATCGAAGSSF